MVVARKLFFGSPILISVLFSACNSTSYNHYVKSAQVNSANIPLIPAVNNLDSTKNSAFGFHGGFRNTRSMDLRTPEISGQAIQYYPAPGDYTLQYEKYNLGLDYQNSLVEVFDLFASIAVDATRNHTYGSGLMGIGLTLPFPWMTIRVAPAVGLFTFRGGQSDSIISSYVNDGPPLFFGPPPDPVTVYDTNIRTGSNRNPHLGGLLAVSVSMWAPGNLNERILNPYMQFQYNRLHLTTPTLPGKVASIQSMIFGIGTMLDLGRFTTWNTKVMREFIFNEDSHSGSFRAETGLQLKFKND